MSGAAGEDVEADEAGATPRGSWLAAVADGQEQVRAAARVAGSDPTALLERLVATAAALVDAPAAVAVPRDGRLVWWASSGDAQVGEIARGAAAPVDGTLWGEAWRTGTLRRAGDGGTGPALAVPLVHGNDVLGVLVLSAPIPMWLDRNDERAALLLAGTAADGLARLTAPAALPDRIELPELPAPVIPGQAEPPRRRRTDRPGGQLAERPPEFSPPTPAALFLSPAPGRAAPAPRPAMPDPGGMGLWEWDARTGTCTWSAPIERLAGLRPGEELTLDTLRDAVVQADRARFDAALRAVRSGRGAGGALRLRRAGDVPRHVYAWAEVRRDRAGELLGAWGAVVDVSAFEHDAAALRSSVTGLRAAQELTGLGVWEWHPDTGELDWSPEMYRLLGLAPGDLEPTLDRWHAYVHPEDVGRARALDVDLLEGGTGGAPADVEGVQTFRVVRDDGEVRHVQSWSSSLTLIGGPGTPGPVVVHGAVLDVTRQVRDRVMLERLSTTDTVTDLGNRLAFDRRMQDLLARPGADVSLMLLDLDRFKLVNDSLGHQVGDRLLHEVAQRLLAVVPEGTTTARMGGDEFVVVPPAGMPAGQVELLAEKVVETLREPYALPETGEIICPVSVGVTSTHRRTVTPVDLLREADIALYRAKDTGRDRFVVFDDALRTRAQARQRSERRVREALERGLLQLEYQPIVDFGHGRVVGAEALVRMRDPEDEARLLSPDMFMDVAEDTGLVVLIDTWVIDEALDQLRRWGDRPGPSGEPPWLAVNVSPRSMEHPRVARRLVDALAAEDRLRDRIKVELTEHSFLSQLPGGEASLRALMAAGVRVGIDDFGTGYSAMAYLPRFDLDFMKIDKSFVRDVGRVGRADAVVTAIVDLAHAHGMVVVAEGVETTTQARRLREIGCDYAQGYHFGRPGSPSRILRR